jgi:phosphoribosyl-dephospho-CoA transferase
MYASPLRRHAFVWLSADAHLRDAVTCEPPDAPIVSQWIDARRPLVVRRQPSTCRNGGVALGIASTPETGKRRIGVEVRRDAIDHIAPPPALRSVARSAPPHARVQVAALCAAAEAASLDMRVFGSFAWETLTGLAYVTAASDLDVLWQPRRAADIDAGIALLEKWERTGGMRVDGEIVLGDDHAVAWREWSTSGTRVLVKRLHDVQLREPAELLAVLERAPSTTSEALP